jgi:hypothetical protein
MEAAAISEVTGSRSAQYGSIRRIAQKMPVNMETIVPLLLQSNMENVRHGGF